MDINKLEKIFEEINKFPRSNLSFQEQEDFTKYIEKIKPNLDEEESLRVIRYVIDYFRKSPVSQENVYGQYSQYPTSSTQNYDRFGNRTN